MYQNPYLNVQPYQNYMQYPYMRQPVQQPVQQPQQEIYFNDIRFATDEEAKAFLPAPNTRLIFVVRDKSIFYVKSCDQAGNSTMKSYSYAEIGVPDATGKDIQPVVEYVKADDIKDFVRKDELKSIATIDDLKAINSKLAELQKQIKINNILKDEGEQLSLYGK